jgi:hypothetical protein
MKVTAITILLATVTTASAEPEKITSEVIATQPLALVARGVSVSYERRVAERWSAAGVVGVRASALGDFSSSTVTAGGELRRWLRERTPMRGPYVGFHASVGHTRLGDDEMGHVGSSTGLTERVDLGWRFTIRNRVAIAPSLSIGARQDIAQGLATTSRPLLAIGLELGWMR